MATMRFLAPPPEMTISEWADTYRMLSPVTSAEPGHWETSRCEYQRGIMDAISDPKRHEIVVMSSAQVGKTESILNTIGYYIHLDPCQMLMVMPDINTGKNFSVERVDPTIKETPVLNALVEPDDNKKEGSKISRKMFKNGFLAITGANVPKDLSSRSIRVLLCDEIDQYKTDIAGQGSPLSIAYKRTITFWNHKVVYTSTPTIAGLSAIERLYNKSDKREYYVPCPYCGHMQTFSFDNLTYKLDKNNNVIVAEVLYLCQNCHKGIPESKKLQMILKGEWRAGDESSPIAGFHLNALYSTFCKWHRIIKEFEDCRLHPEEYKTFKNTMLGLPTTLTDGGISDSELQEHIDNFDKLPIQVCVLTAGVDVQDNRIECTVWGWSKDEEAWSVDRQIFSEKRHINEDTWKRLDEFIIKKRYPTADGFSMPISLVAIDSGFNTDAVYKFVNKRSYVVAIKGSNQDSAPLCLARKVNKNSSNAGQVLYHLGVSRLKEIFYARLTIRERGASYIHLRKSVCDQYKKTDKDFLKQLCSEQSMIVDTRRGKKKEWKKVFARNEVLDTTLYAYACLHMGILDLESIVRNQEFRNVKIYPLRNRLNEDTRGDFVPVKKAGKKVVIKPNF